MTALRRPCISTDRVRWADVDLVGIMRFSAFTRLVENAEQELFRAAGLPYSDAFHSPEIVLPRRSLNIGYTMPARLDDELVMAAYISRTGDSSMTLNVEVMSPDFSKLYASAAVVVVCVNVSDFRKRTLPENIRRALEPFMMSTDHVRSLAAAGQLSVESL